MAEKKPEIFDAGDREQVTKRKSKDKLRREQEQRDLCAVLSTEAGMRFTWRLLSQCGIHSDPFHTNALVMAKAVGAQSIGRFIEVEIAEACPNKFLEMQLLNQKEESNG